MPSGPTHRSPYQALLSFSFLPIILPFLHTPKRDHCKIEPTQLICLLETLWKDELHSEQLITLWNSANHLWEVLKILSCKYEHPCPPRQYRSGSFKGEGHDSFCVAASPFFQKQSRKHPSCFCSSSKNGVPTIRGTKALFPEGTRGLRMNKDARPKSHR